MTLASPRTEEIIDFELLDLETWEAPRRLSHDDRLDHTGGHGRRQPRTEPEQDDDQ
jgi:hypothetical protein